MTVFAVEYVYSAESDGLIREHRPAHRAWLAELLEDGRLLASGPFGDGSGALLLFVAADEEDLHEVLRQDPLAAAGAISGLRATQWQPVLGPFSAYV